MVWLGYDVTILFIAVRQCEKYVSSCCCTGWEDNTSKQWFCLIFGQLTRHPLIELFRLFNLLQMLNDHRMVDIEFLGNFSCSCKRLSFDDCQPLCSSSSKLLSPLHKLLEPPLHSCSLVVPGSNALLILQIVSVRKTKFWTRKRKLLELAFCLTSFT